MKSLWDFWRRCVENPCSSVVAIHFGRQAFSAGSSPRIRGWFKQGACGIISFLFIAKKAKRMLKHLNRHGLITLVASAPFAISCFGANPFITSLYTADPSAHVWSDGRLYVYPSRDIDPPRGCDLMDRYHVFSTADMVNWRDEGEILRANQVPWGRKEGGFMWAPDCAYRNGTYYYYFPHPTGTHWNDTWKIGVATSTNPASDFRVTGYLEG